MNKVVWRLPVIITVALVISSGRSAQAQTPSPLQEWQYSGGIILARLFEPDLPNFRSVTGLAAEAQPIYDGSHAYRVQGGPVINIQYRDIAFVRTGDGIGYNFLRGDHYQVGAGMTYDFGRKMKYDYTNLRGMGDISAAPVAKVFASVVLSKKFPVIIRADVRRSVDQRRHAPLPTEPVRGDSAAIAYLRASCV